MPANGGEVAAAQSPPVVLFLNEPPVDVPRVMASLWRKVRQPRKTSQLEFPRGKSYESDGSDRSSDYAKGLENASNELPQQLVHNGRAMQLLRHVHLVDPVHSPSWSGIQRSDQATPSVLHLLAREPLDSSGPYEVLQPGVVELTTNPNMIYIRGLLLDTIKHIGPVANHIGAEGSFHEPPKWLKKLALSKNSAALREISLNVAAGTPRKKDSIPSPRAALQDKYEDFLVSVFGAIQHDAAKHSASPKMFDNVRMCVTEAGFFGLVPPSTRVGDIIFMIEKDPRKTLFIVRKHPVHGFYLWNGMVYIYHLAETLDNTYATDRIVVG